MTTFSFSKRTEPKAPSGPKESVGFTCPECAALARKVTDSRAMSGGVRRRRECENGHRFSTVEIPAGELDALRAQAVEAEAALIKAVRTLLRPLRGGQ